MTVASLVNLIAGADKKQHGCTVEFYHINGYFPPDGTPANGIVRWGLPHGVGSRPSNERVFHSIEELARILTRLQL